MRKDMDTNYIANFLKCVGCSIEDNTDKEDIERGIDRYITVELLKNNCKSFEDARKLDKIKEAIINCL